MSVSFSPLFDSFFTSHCPLHKDLRSQIAPLFCYDENQVSVWGVNAHNHTINPSKTAFNDSIYAIIYHLFERMRKSAHKTAKPARFSRRSRRKLVANVGGDISFEGTAPLINANAR